jgi:hypothetical protein
MTGGATDRPDAATQPAYHLLLDPDEVPMLIGALRLFISDEAHQQRIRELGREVLAAMQQAPDELGALSVPLSAEGMKVSYSALRLMLNDSQRGQADERATLRAILDKLPDEHSMRAISIE